MLELGDNIYNRRVRRDEPKLKKWRDAGLILTYRCNCACEFCYYRCGPHKGGLMPVDMAIQIWQGLRRIAGSHARVHLTGGEPFLVWDRLLAVLRAAQDAGLGPVGMVETNGYWATSEDIVQQRLALLNELGVQRLKISCDPFHQAFVDIERVRCLVRGVEAQWGPERVLVRWRHYLEDTAASLPPEDAQTLERYHAALDEFDCRYSGRAADRLAGKRARHAVASFHGQDCRASFLGAKGVHVDPWGHVFSGTCSGIVIGRVDQKPLDQLWCDFDPDHHPVVGTLARSGPAGLMRDAVQDGHRPSAHFATRCHLCTEARMALRQRSPGHEALGPDACYEP
jgi:hypothetical protein